MARSLRERRLEGGGGLEKHGLRRSDYMRLRGIHAGDASVSGQASDILS
jgi:hypothetical protein